MNEQDIVSKLDKCVDWLNKQIILQENNEKSKDYIQIKKDIIDYFNYKKYLNFLIKNITNDKYIKYCNYLIENMNNFEKKSQFFNQKNIKKVKLKNE